MMPSIGPFRVALLDLPPDVDAQIREALAGALRARYEIHSLDASDDPARLELPPDVVAARLTDETQTIHSSPGRVSGRSRLILIADPAAEAEARRRVECGDAADYLLADQLSSRLVEATVRAAAEAARAQQPPEEELAGRVAQLEGLVHLQEAILASTPEHFFVFDRMGVCTYASPMAAKLLRCDEMSQLVGLTWHDIELVAPYGAHLDVDFATCREHGEPVRRVIDYEGRSQRRWFEFILTPILDAGAQTGDVVMTLHEITDFKQAEMSLRQAILESNQFAVALENLRIGVVLTDPSRANFPVMYTNPAFTAITGYAPEEVMGRGLDLLEGVHTDPEVRDTLRRALASEQPFAGELLNYRKDGKPFWNELQITPVRDSDGRLVRFVELQTDVTERRNAEARFQRQIEFERLIAGISAKFIRLSPDEVDAAIHQALMDIGMHLDATHCVIGRFTADGMHITHEWRDPNLTSVLLEPIAAQMSEDVLAWFTAPLRSLQPLFVPDVLTSAKDIPQLAVAVDAGLRALLALPLVIGAEAIGFLGMATVRTAPYWSPEDVTLLRLATEILVGGLERKERRQAMEESERRLREVVTNAPVMLVAFNTEGRITLAGGRALEAPFTGISRASGQMLADIFSETYPYVLENCRRALAGETFSTVLRAGPAGQSVLDVRYIPLRDGRAQIVGGMLVGMDITERYKAEVAEREQRALAEALRDTASALNSSLDANEVMRFIVESVDRVVPNEAATIILIEGQEARVAHSSGRHTYMLDAHYTDVRFPLNIHTLSTMSETGEPLLIPDVRRYPQWVPVPESGWIRSYLGVPIRAYGKIIGFLNLDSSIPNFFTSEHVERLQAVAGQAASALQNAQLYAVVRRDADELAFLNRATSFLSLSFVGTLSLTDMGHRVAEAIEREFPSLGCRVLVLNEDYQLVELARAGGYTPELPSTVRLEDQTAIAEAIWQGKGMYVLDSGPTSLNRPGDPRTRAELALPLLTATDVIGVLDLQSEEYDAFSDRDLRVLEAFAERAAAAIDNVRLYERVLRHTSELEERVRERTATLEAERAQLNAILESMTEAVIYGELVGSMWRSRYANRALWDMLGYTVAEMPLGSFSLAMFVPQRSETPQAALPEILERLVTTPILQQEIVLRRKDGSSFDAHITVIHIRSAQSDKMEILCVLRDISKEKSLQEQKDRFIANASHELRTPITNLKMRLYLLARQPHLLTEHIAMLELVSDRMQDLVDDLLDVSRFERGVLPLQREPVIIQELVNGVLDLQRPHADKRALRLTCQLPDAPVVGNVDAVRIVQVITNLVINAINYTPEGGEVSVELLADDADGSHDILIRVRDTGIGIPPDLQQQIFDPFFRINVGMVRGTGLGLTISREIVKLHGGTIDVQSIEEVGTTFTVRLPGLPPGAQALPRAALSGPSSDW